MEWANKVSYQEKYINKSQIFKHKYVPSRGQLENKQRASENKE